MGRGQLVDTTFSDGMMIKEYWWFLLRENELAYRSGRFDAVLTDEQLRDRIANAFPGRDTESWVKVVRYRAAYNRGALKGGTLPIWRSNRYGRVDGKVVVLTARGTVISNE